MELDKRIIEGKRPLTCLDIEQAREFVGKECIFSDIYASFKDINQYLFVHSECTAILSIDEIASCGDYVFRNAKNNLRYSLILPLEWVKPEEPEKKYRPFTLNEFLNRYRLGNTVYFRRIGYKEVKCAMFVEYVRGESPEENQIVLGSMRYTLAYLFKNYELSLEDIWQPFGVMEDD